MSDDDNKSGVDASKLFSGKDVGASTEEKKPWYERLEGWAESKLHGNFSGPGGKVDSVKDFFDLNDPDSAFGTIAHFLKEHKAAFGGVGALAMGIGAFSLLKGDGFLSKLMGVALGGLALIAGKSAWDAFSGKSEAADRTLGRANTIYVDGPNGERGTKGMHVSGRQLAQLQAMTPAPAK